MIPQSDAEKFRKALQSIKKCNSNMLMHVMRGTRAMKAKYKLDDDVYNDFLDDFLTVRIGTDILSSQYLAITKPSGKYHYGYAPPVDVVDVGQVRFPFIKAYLHYILFELLKNSLRAVTERFSSDEAAKRPVRVVVCGDESSVVIRISDTGGGIPLEALSKIWSYLYTTARPQDGEEDSDEDSDSDDVAPMAGFGCGLPLSRNYAAYVGGRLEIQTLPQWGTDAYLYLNRLGNATEIVDVEPQAILPSRGFLPRIDL